MPDDDQQQQPPPPHPPATSQPPPGGNSGGAADQQQQPRKKRAKIVSACGECRRKKTKCNGEQPCRSCEKSGVPCIYPSATQNQGDDKRSTLNKVALEAIEERLKTIEDMLRVILQSAQHSSADLDPAIVHQFLTSTRPSSSSSSSLASSPPTVSASSNRHPSSPPPMHYPQPHQAQPQLPPPPPPPPPPIQQQQHYLPQQQQQQQQRLSEYDIRLPSIHNLSAPSAYHPHEHHPDIPHSYRPPSASSGGRSQISPESEDYGAFQPVKKRKR